MAFNVVKINTYPGVLAGIWPCGIITLLNELYISESKSQVYGAIHSFFQSNEDSMTDLSKILSNDIFNLVACLPNLQNISAMMMAVT